MDVPPVHVDTEADAHADDLLEAWPPRFDVEESGDELAPRRETRPVEVGDAEATTTLRRCERRDDRQRAIGPREVG